MADTKINEATKNLIKSVQEVNKAFANTAITTQERNLAFAQSVLENGIEVLRSHAESSRALSQELVERARKGRLEPEALQSLIESAITAQDRNTRLAQSVLENGVEVLKSQVNVTRSLMEELGTQFQKQQEAFQTIAQESMEAYKDFVFAPFTFWQKAFETVEAATVEGLKNFRQATEQELETIQRASRQAASMTEKAVRHAPPVTPKTSQ